MRYREREHPHRQAEKLQCEASVPVCAAVHMHSVSRDTLTQNRKSILFSISPPPCFTPSLPPTEGARFLKLLPTNLRSCYWLLSVPGSLVQTLSALACPSFFSASSWKIKIREKCAAVSKTKWTESTLQLLAHKQTKNYTMINDSIAAQSVFSLALVKAPQHHLERRL